MRFHNLGVTLCSFFDVVRYLLGGGSQILRDTINRSIYKQLLKMQLLFAGYCSLHRFQIGENKKKMHKPSYQLFFGSASELCLHSDRKWSVPLRIPSIGNFFLYAARGGSPDLFELSDGVKKQTL